MEIPKRDKLLRLLAMSTEPSTTLRIETALERAVAIGLYPDGVLPSERLLAETLDVSRSSVRAALTLIRESGYAQESLLGRAGGAPTTERPPLSAVEIRLRAKEALSEIDELMSARMMVEQSCIRNLAATRQDSLVERMLGSHETALSDRSPLTARVTDSDFHLALSCASESIEIVGLSLRARADLIRWRDRLPMVDALDESLSGHQAILDAVIAGDPDSAAAAVKDHLDETTVLYVAILTEYMNEPEASRAVGEAAIAHALSETATRSGA